MLVGGRYELAQQVAASEGSRTFAARDSATGRAVLLHQIIEPPAGGIQPSLRVLASRCAAGKGGVIGRLQSEGQEYLVTEAGDEFLDLRAALERAALVPHPAPASAGEDRFARVGAWRVPAGFPARAAPQVSAEPSASGVFGVPPGAASAGTAPPADDLTRTFLPSAPEPAETPAPAQPAGAVPAPPPVPADEGEFTRMFRSPAAAQPVSSPQPPAPAEPGEFTRMFQAQDAAGGSAAPPRPASPAPGDFTRLFQPAEPAKPLPPQAPPAASGEGDFTRYFHSPLGSGTAARSEAAPPPPAAAPPPAAPQPGEYTRLFQTPASPATPPASASGATGAFLTPGAFASGPPSPVEEGPSDFTRIIQARPPAAAGAAALEPARAAPAEPAARPRTLPAGLVVLFASLAVLAVLMILFFALRR